MSVVVFSALFQITNMGIFCFDRYFHILRKTVIEKPFQRWARTRTLKHILKERQGKIAMEIRNEKPDLTGN